MRRSSTAHIAAALALASVSIGCGGPPSALSPAGRDAEHIASLFHWLAGGAALIWLTVMGLTVYAVVLRDREHDRIKTKRVLVSGGTAVTTIIVTIMLVFGLRGMPALLDRGPEGPPRIYVSGEQWWWRVRYELAGGAQFELANELRLPRGARMPLFLVSPDVIHSLWVPALAGKVDMIPGRVNRMALQPTKTGVFPGVCAEYCGVSHARMMFHAVVIEPSEFEDWARAQQAVARAPLPGAATRGAELFAMHGCGACHAIRGTSARGVIGPDLTHVGGRVSIGAGTLENEIAGFETWLAKTKEVKPGVHMPAFDMLSIDERRAIATYLDGLQ
jgi:cytochrome c oxidase subunit 2